MAKAGDVLENPKTGDRIVFRRTAAETNGEVLEYELTYRPSGFVTRDHLHPLQDERHEVLEGELGLVVGDEDRRLRPGDAVVVPKGAPHRIYATSDEPVHALFELRPALETEVLLETFAGLARDGKVNDKGEPGLLQLAVIFREFGELGRPTKPPPAVQTALFAPLAELGRLRGYRARYPEYSGGA